MIPDAVSFTAGAFHRLYAPLLADQPERTYGICMAQTIALSRIGFSAFRKRLLDKRGAADNPWLAL
jgi:hypothetical protein